MRRASSVGRTVVVAVGLALTIGACGKTQDVSVGDPTPARLGAAAQAMAEAGTGTYSGTVSFTIGGDLALSGALSDAEVTMTMAISGSYDVAQGRSAAHLEVTAIDGDARAVDPDLIVGDRYDIVTDGDVSYERSTTGGEVDLYDGSEWRRQSSAGSELLVPGIDEETLSVDPDGLFEQLQALSDTVEDLGAQSIGGVQTHHYRAEVSMAKLAELNEATMGTAVYGNSTESLEGITLPVDVFIDGQGLVRRYVTEVDYGAMSRQAMEAELEDMSAYGSVPGAPDDYVFVIRFELDFAGIGEPVTIDLPDGNTVGTEPEPKFEAVGEAIEVTPGTTSGTAMTAGTIDPHEELVAVYQVDDLIQRGTSLEEALAQGQITVEVIPAQFAPDSALEPGDAPTGVALFDLAPGTIVVKDMFTADNSPDGP